MIRIAGRAALAAIGLFALGTPGVTASPAPAAALPVVYNDSSGWTHFDIRPKWVLVGQGGAPMAHTWYWNTWNQSVAESAGTLWVERCVPDCARGKMTYHHLLVTLSRVRYRDGRAYYSQMAWYTPGYRIPGDRSSTLIMHVNARGFWD